MSASSKRPPYDRWRWAMCVAFATAPLALFVVTVWAFLGSDKQLYSVSGTIEGPPIEPVVHAHVDIVILDYSMYAYVHVIFSLAALSYFLMAMQNHARARGIAVRFEVGFAVLVALVVCLAIVIMTVNEFRSYATFPLVIAGLYVEPYIEPMKHLLGTDEPGHDWHGRSWQPIYFLYLSVLGPAVPGVFAVVFCTSTFHHIVCSRRLDRRDDIEYCLTVLKRQLTVLSLVLVSSVVVTRDYVDLLPSLLALGESKPEVYSALASSLTFAGSLLFSATLVAVFVPGVVALLRGFPHLSSGDKCIVLKRLNLVNFTGKATSIVQTVLTLAAPVLAGTLLELIGL